MISVGHEGLTLKFEAAYADRDLATIRYVFSVPKDDRHLWVVVKLFPDTRVHTVKVWSSPVCSPRANHWRTDIAIRPSVQEISDAFDLAKDTLNSAISAFGGWRV